ncbi:hypothetical protein [Amycolatopsis tucumanensis]|uniref:hypothetical protein n=1 Tax=Amycolatopsis tucumanensis TaxID=401106 RepID=UPI001F2F7D1F|nr:hypothetical protein [Amycolatopsis tucumanensis]MCF6423974.1 hypothetical protein [Amycolatopsis tucumanensis]
MKLLDPAEHLRNERESLGRYPRNSDGAIDWTAVPEELVISSTNRDSPGLDAIIQQFVSGVGNIVVFWGSLAIPSLELSCEDFLAHLSDVLDSNIADFWIYSPSDDVVLEFSFFGVVTVAHLPMLADG